MQKYAWQNSWGLTTRTVSVLPPIALLLPLRSPPMCLQIGVCVMVHGDNKGLVLPPRVAPLQVIIVPISASSDAPEVVAGIVAMMKQIEADLKAAGVRVKIDDRDNYLPGWKYAHWEQKVRVVRCM